MKKGFTLAEVLITLGIIGVVASLTMPVLISNYRKTEIETRLKKVYSVINQAVYMSSANGTWTMPPTDQRGNNDALDEWLQSALFQYIRSVKHFEVGEFNHPLGNTNRSGIILSDGTILWFNNNGQIFVFVDINGLKGPNKNGVDYFNFFLDYQSSKLGYFYPSGYAYAKKDENDDNYGDVYVYGDREKMKNYCSNGNLLYTNSNTCALLIMYDGWKISKDYPVKI